MIYYYYSKVDSKKEPIQRFECNCFEEALEYFTNIKHLSKHEFLDIYEILTHPR